MCCVKSKRGRCESASPEVPKQEIDLMQPCSQPPATSLAPPVAKNDPKQENVAASLTGEAAGYAPTFLDESVFEVYSIDDGARMSSV